VSEKKKTYTIAWAKDNKDNAINTAEDDVSLNDLAWVKRCDANFDYIQWNITISEKPAPAAGSDKVACSCELGSESHAQALANAYQDYYQKIEEVYDPYCNALAAFRTCKNNKWQKVTIILSQKLADAEVRKYCTKMKHHLSTMYKTPEESFFDNVVETKDGQLDRRLVVRKVADSQDAPQPDDIVVSVQSPRKSFFGLIGEKVRGLGWTGKIINLNHDGSKATIEWSAQDPSQNRPGPPQVFEEKDVKLNDLMWATRCEYSNTLKCFRKGYRYAPPQPKRTRRRLTDAQRLLNRFIRVGKRCQEF